jgi:hypothetical protein
MKPHYGCGKMLTYLLTIVLDTDDPTEVEVLNFRIFTCLRYTDKILYDKFCDAWLTAQTQCRVVSWQIELFHAVQCVEL